MFLAQQPGRSGARRRIRFVIVALAASELVSINTILTMRAYVAGLRDSLSHFIPLLIAIISLTALDGFCIDVHLSVRLELPTYLCIYLCTYLSECLCGCLLVCVNVCCFVLLGDCALFAYIFRSLSSRSQSISQLAEVI